MRKFVLALSVAAIAAGSSTACATKGFVKNRVGEVNDKVESVSRSRSRRRRSGPARTRRPSPRPTSASCRLTRRPAAAQRRGGHRADGGRHRRDQGRGGGEGHQADRLRSDAQRGPGQLQVRPRRVLPDEAKARLDEVVQQLKANPNGAYIEVEGLHRQHRVEGLQREAGPRARRVGEALPVPGAPDPAAPDQRDQLRPGQPGGAEQDARTAARRTAGS